MSSFCKIEQKDNGKYLLILSAGNWNITRELSDNELKDFADTINEARGISQIISIFNCTAEQAEKLRDAWGEGKINRSHQACRNCDFKRKDCFRCQFVCQSPLEEAMFLEFKRRDIYVTLQKRISKDGTSYDYPEKIDKETILTIPDFYIENEKNKVCIYADGKTYHYNNEYQGIRDRSIDIALQNLGYKVLRYTGSQIRDNVKAVVDNVINSTN